MLNKNSGNCEKTKKHNLDDLDDFFHLIDSQFQSINGGKL